MFDRKEKKKILTPEQEEENLRMMEESDRVIRSNPLLFSSANTVIGEMRDFEEWQHSSKEKAKW